MKVSNFINKMKNRHVLSLVGNFSMSVLSFITYVILYRKMSKSDVGNWVYFQFIFLLADTLRTGFIHSALIRFYSGTGQLGKKFIGSGWVIAGIITAIYLILNIIIYFLPLNMSDPVWEILINYIGICLLLILPLNYSTWILQANNKFDRILIIRVINQGGFIIFILLLSYFQLLNLYNLILAFVLANLITSSVCLFSGWTQLFSIKYVNKESLKTFFNYGKYSTGTVVSSNLLKSSDAFLVKYFLGAEALAIYNLPQKLLEVIEIPIRSIIMTAMPEMSKKTHENGIQAAGPVMIKYAGFLTLLLIPVSVISIVFSNLAILIIGGKEYLNSEAPNIFKIFILLAVFLPIDRFLGITLDIINKPKLNFFKVIIMLLVQVFGGLIALYFIKSIYAIAVVSIITFAAGVLFGHLSLRKYISYSLPDLWYYGKAEITNIWKTVSQKIKLG
jgi:O-antigen/teichoic acid export membrane protein